MELLAYIPAVSIHDYNAIASDSDANENIATVDPFLRNWLKNIGTKSVKLSLSTILAGTTVLVGLGSTLSVLAAVSPSSADVEYVQSLLAKNGFDPGAVDGVAGAATKNAILRAQKSLGLPMDGVAGSQTIAALEGNKAAAPLEVDAQPVMANSSATVMNLQKLLADRGFYNGAIDGIMGAQTRAAIVAAQKAYNLTADGVAGEQTLAALESDRAVVAASSSPTTVTKSADTVRLQELLSDRGFYNGAIDGIMGAQTRAAIVAAQKSYGLTTDGVAGAKTIAALESGASVVNTANSNATNAATTAPASTVSNQDVAALQQLLARRGFYKGAIDGVRGSQTNAAIAEAQKAYGLTVDSIAGAQTIAALERDARPAATQATTTDTTGTSDNSVANLQNLLTDRGFYSGPITGFLGSRTREAIIAAQKAYGLTADGIAGAKTIAALEAGAPQTQIATVRPVPAPPVAPVPPVTAPPIRVVPVPQTTSQPTVAPQPIPVQPQAVTPKPAVTPVPQVTPQVTVKATPTPTPQVAAVAQVSDLQQLLARRGFYTGKPDGVLNAETRNAIVRAQNFYTISPADGSPSSKLIDSLSKDTFISDGN